MQIVLDLDAYWFAVACIAATLGGFWSFKRVKALVSGR